LLALKLIKLSYFYLIVTLTTKQIKRSIGVNFINTLLEPFCTKVLCAAFHKLQLGFVIFWQKNISAKAARKMLMKLTIGRKKKLLKKLLNHLSHDEVT